MRQRAYVEHAESLESTKAAQELRLEQLEPLECSPNFPRAQYLDICIAEA